MSAETTAALRDAMRAYQAAAREERVATNAVYDATTELENAKQRRSEVAMRAQRALYDLQKALLADCDAPASTAWGVGS